VPLPIAGEIRDLPRFIASDVGATDHGSELAAENWHRRQFVNLSLALEIEPRPAERIAGEHQHARDTALG
jgi:hypothetical protein